MRRILMVSVLAGALVVFTAGPAFAAHCVNLSKNEGAGNHTNVVIDLTTGTVNIQKAGNGNGWGGYADVWLDFDGDLVGDLLVESDIQLGKNHATVAHLGTSFPDSLEPWVNPGAIAKFISDHATHDHGMGFHD